MLLQLKRLVSCSPVNLYRTTRLSRGFRYTTKRHGIKSMPFAFSIFLFQISIQGEEKWMQNEETEHRRWLPEAVPRVRRAVRFIHYAPFIKPS